MHLLLLIIIFRGNGVSEKSSSLVHAGFALLLGARELLHSQELCLECCCLGSLVWWSWARFLRGGRGCLSVPTWSVKAGLYCLNLCAFWCCSALCCCTQQISRVLHTSWQYSSLFLRGEKKHSSSASRVCLLSRVFFFYFSTCLKYFEGVAVFLWDVAYKEVFVLKFQSGKNWQNKQVGWGGI